MKIKVWKPWDIFRKVFPILRWIVVYDSGAAIADVIAGITVGLTLIPQAIAYAALAGLDPQYGLYSSLCGGVVYAIFGTVPQLNIAPTTLLSLLTFTYSYESPFGVAQAAIFLCFFSGLVEIGCGLLHLGFLVDFVSAPVVAGMTSAGALYGATAQIKNLLGLNFKAEKFIDIWINIVEHITETKLWDAVLSVTCCTLLLALRQLKNYGRPPISGSAEKEAPGQLEALKKMCWFLSVGRNALVVICCTVLAFFLHRNHHEVFSLTNQVPSGLPNISLPPFQVVTEHHTYSFLEMARHLSTGMLVIPFIAILSNVAVAKAFARGKSVDATQEMLAVGLCNVVGAFFSSFAVNASFSRAAVSNASGVRTTFSGIYTGIMVILALTFLTPYFAYIPKATLSSVIICAAIFMVEVNISRLIWKMNKIDFIPLIVTFVSCLLLEFEIGILIGIAVDIILILYYVARPKIEIEQVTIDGCEYSKITPTTYVFYPSTEHLREKIMKSANQNPKSKTVILDCSRITKTDFTAVKSIGSLVEDLYKKGHTIAFLRIDPDLAKLLGRVCSNCLVAYTDDGLAAILKDRREMESNKIGGSDDVENGHISTMSLTVPNTTTTI